MLLICLWRVHKYLDCILWNNLLHLLILVKVFCVHIHDTRPQNTIAQVLEWRGTTEAQGNTESWNGMKLERKIRQVSDSVFYWLKTGGLLSVLWAVFMAEDVLARTMHEKERGKQVNFRHTSQKCHGNISSSPKDIKVDGKIPGECRELWIPGFPREIVKVSFLAHFK